jgi:quinol monooxygenase YgiN
MKRALAFVAVLSCLIFLPLYGHGNATHTWSPKIPVGIFVKVHAKPGKEADLAKFLGGALPLANKEPYTIVWFALKLGPGTYGIFDAFPDDAGREEHLKGPIAAALMANASELLSEPPQIDKIDVLAAKLSK